MRTESPTLHAFRLLVPAFWMGLLVGLAFIETPLKFLAPGMTLELALGVGRLVLTAADIAGVILLLALTALAFPRPRVGRPEWVTLGGLWLVLLVQVVIIRPILNARSDAVRAGVEVGESQLHTVYVGLDVVLLVGLVLMIVFAVRRRAREGDRLAA